MSSIAQRVKEIKARARVRAWEYRQRHHAHGAWLRYRRPLSMADLAYAIDEAQARQLLAQGSVLDQGGQALAPTRSLVWITREQAAGLAAARPLRLRLDAAMLGEPWVALVPFDEIGVPPPMKI